MLHHLKTLPEYFQAVIDGRKPFEIRKDDRGFKSGDRVELKEFEGYQEIPACPDYGNNCPPVEYDPYTEQEDFAIPEDCRRNCCGAYRKELYTERRCHIKIKDIFELDAAGLTGYVAFTFDILDVTDKKDS